MNLSIARPIGNRLAVTVKGELTEFDISRLADDIAAVLSGDLTEVHMDLSECDIDDPLALVETINFIRGLLRRGLTLTLIDAPQLLAHDLYRVGALLPGSRLTLVRPRNEIGYA